MPCGCIACRGVPSACDSGHLRAMGLPPEAASVGVLRVPTCDTAGREKSPARCHFAVTFSAVGRDIEVSQRRQARIIHTGPGRAQPGVRGSWRASWGAPPSDRRTKPPFPHRKRGLSQARVGACALLPRLAIRWQTCWNHDKCGQLEGMVTKIRRTDWVTSPATLINMVRQVSIWPRPRGSLRRR